MEGLQIMPEPSLRDVFETTVLTRESIMGVPINRVKLNEIFHAHLGEQINAQGPLWSLLSLALWELKLDPQ